MVPNLLSILPVSVDEDTSINCSDDEEDLTPPKKKKRKTKTKRKRKRGMVEYC